MPRRNAQLLLVREAWRMKGRKHESAFVRRWRPSSIVVVDIDPHVIPLADDEDVALGRPNAEVGNMTGGIADRTG